MIGLLLKIHRQRHRADCALLLQLVDVGQLAARSGIWFPALVLEEGVFCHQLFFLSDQPLTVVTFKSR